jgi:hypothetical protein
MMTSREAGKEYAWFMRQPDNIARYKGQVVILHHRTVLGSGADHMEAMEDAQRRAAADNRPLPQADLIAFPVYEPSWLPPEFFGDTPPGRGQGPRSDEPH